MANRLRVLLQHLPDHFLAPVIAPHGLALIPSSGRFANASPESVHHAVFITPRGAVPRSDIILVPQEESSPTT
jgi:hypothetical protein